MLPVMTERLYAQIAALLRQEWDIARLTRLRPVHKGQHGAGFEVVCGDESTLLLLVDQSFPPSAIESGVRAMRHAAELGYPVPKLHETPSGQSVVRGLEGRHALLMEFPEGRAVPSDAVTERVAAAWGERLAICHATLAELADADTPSPPMADNGNTSDRVRRYLERGGVTTPMPLGPMTEAVTAGVEQLQRLSPQLTHGDFSRQAVLFDGTGAVSAVLDWMSVVTRPRSVELLDAVTLLCRRADGVLDVRLASTLIEAYQHVLPLPKVETECPVAGCLAWSVLRAEAGSPVGPKTDERERLTCLWGARPEIDRVMAGT